jgi:ZIP family zinc transporter
LDAHAPPRVLAERQRAPPGYAAVTGTTGTTTAAMDLGSPAFTSGSFGFAFGLTLVAGLATGVGSALAFFAKRTNLRLLAQTLAFSAGVMLYVSFMEILPESSVHLARHFGARTAGWLANAGFFGGILAMALIDYLVPSADNPHELRADSDLDVLKIGGQFPAGDHEHGRHLWRLGFVTAAAIAIHNFPEGMATFLAALNDPRTGFAIAAAVALHNIPEGISVSVPIFYATGRRGRAFTYSLLTGLSEPLGGLVAAFALNWFLPDYAMGLVFASVAGVMVYVSIDELLPTAHRYGRSHEILACIAGGMAVMAVSLQLLG